MLLRSGDQFSSQNDVCEKTNVCPCFSVPYLNKTGLDGRKNVKRFLLKLFILVDHSMITELLDHAVIKMHQKPLANLPTCAVHEMAWSSHVQLHI